MDFFIKKNATLPLLVMRVIKDGRSDFHKYFESLTSTTINFSMKNVDTQKFKIINGPCVIKKYTNGETDEYVLHYQFKNRDTNLVGRYEGEFNIQYNDGVVGLPLKDKIYINIVDSFATNNLTYSSGTATIINNICCVESSVITPTPSFVNINILALISGGSISIQYNSNSSVPVFTAEYDILFNNNLTFKDNSSETVNVLINVKPGQTTGTTKVILPDNFNNLSDNITFSEPTLSITGTTFDYSVNIDLEFLTPLNDFTYLILPDNDFNYLIIPNDDFAYFIIPDNDFNYLVIPNDDFIYSLLPNNDINYLLIPINDIFYEILIS